MADPVAKGLAALLGEGETEEPDDWLAPTLSEADPVAIGLVAPLTVGETEALAD